LGVAFVAGRTEAGPPYIGEVLLEVGLDLLDHAVEQFVIFHLDQREPVGTIGVLGGIGQEEAQAAVPAKQRKRPTGLRAISSRT
jgi:hypothetical protein